MRPHTSAPLQALYRVFVQPALHAPRPQALRPLPRPSPRPFSSSGRTLLASRPPEKRTQLWDEEIRARRVALVDPETGGLQAPRALREVLGSYDHKTHRLVCVTAPPPAGDWTAEWVPTCKLVDKKAAYQADKAKTKAKALQKKNGADAAKTLELNWAIDANDLAHRMKRMQEFLEEGRKVEIVLARKKKGRKATGEECEGLLKTIEETAEAVKGAKKVKAFEGKMAGMASMTFEGTKA